MPACSATLEISCQYDSDRQSGLFSCKAGCFVGLWVLCWALHASWNLSVDLSKR